MFLRKNEIITFPNLLTSFRIVGAFAIWFTLPLSLPFFIVYTLCGVTDGFDGFLARKLGQTSDFGSRLDSVSDLLFYASMLIRLFPILWKLLPKWIWYAVASALLIRAMAYLTAFLKFRRFASVHTYCNKLTGLLLFLLPYFLLTEFAVAFSALICVTALLSSCEELLMHLVSHEYDPDVKTVFALKKKEEPNRR